MTAPHRYGGLEAAAYDRLDELADFDDYPFYRWFAEICGGPILDLGCGTGRIALPLAAEGFEVTGLDAAPAMLEQARAKAAAQGLTLHLRCGDLRRFRLPRRFRLAIAPGFTLQLLADTREIAACLAGARAALRPGGALVISHFAPLEILAEGRRASGWAKRKRAAIPETGETWRAWQRWRVNRRTKRLTLENRYERCGQGGRVLESQTSNMALRWYARPTLERLLRQAGFYEVETYGDFLLQPPGPDTEATAVAGRAAEDG